MTYYNEHSKVWVSVDVIIFGFDESKLKILIGRRQMDPGRGQWSLYGGFVGADESDFKSCDYDSKNYCCPVCKCEVFETWMAF